MVGMVERSRRKNSVAVLAFVSWERWVFVRPVLLMSSERVKGTG